MKSFFNHSLVLFMIVAVLASSTGITVFKMVCGSSGKEIVSLAQISNCCKNKKQETESIEKKCCDFSTLTYKISLLHKTESKSISFNLPEFEHAITAFIFRPFNQIVSVVIRDTSPPKSGRQILSLISSFLI